ncbi:MAG: ComEC/Rec2 family competence protein [Leptolyngbyaceae cyanobacterium bins.59]|nr:ComEC/Rec2 family competence protein [Leptolyngbyaceae cyanobacterium bins.59]
MPAVRRRIHLSRPIVLLAGFIGFIASLYFTVRIPYPGPSDISSLIALAKSGSSEQTVTVLGKIASTPRLTRNQRVQFWLKTTHMHEVTQEDIAVQANQSVTGKLYVTVPLLQGTGLQPNQAVKVSGTLYKPKPATNPGGFDFQAYLAQEGGFAGLRGRTVNFDEDAEAHFQWNWWEIRQRIMRSQVRGAGSPEGPLISAMVLGSRVVDLPYNIRDQFSQVGLAHALAASGFQISLILGVLLALGKRFSKQVQFWSGTLSLLIFVGLAGLQPSVIRAAVMGMAVLTSLLLDRKTKSLGSLLTAATFMLLFNPLWIWDLGFQFSFLATLGLLITAPTVIKWLDWMPTTIASLLAVPIAAYLWTLPLQIYAFNIISPYSIPVNIVTTPLVSIISLGGFISACLSLIWPMAGNFTASLLYYPTHWLIAIVDASSHLPRGSVATGTISVLQLLILYGLVLSFGRHQKSKKDPQGKSKKAINLRWRFLRLLALTIGIGSIILPGWWLQSNQFQITVLATGNEPIFLAQERGKTLLFNSGDERTARSVLLPFLRNQGINQIDSAIATHHEPSFQKGWLTLLQNLPITHFYSSFSPEKNLFDSSQIFSSKSELNLMEKALETRQIISDALSLNQPIKIGSIDITLIHQNPIAIDFKIHNEHWLYLGNLQASEEQQLLQLKNLSRKTVLWWAGESLSEDLLAKLQPEVAIASANTVKAETVEAIQRRKTPFYWTGHAGALTWKPGQGFETVMDTQEKALSAI